MAFEKKRRLPCWEVVRLTMLDSVEEKRFGPFPTERWTRDFAKRLRQAYAEQDNIQIEVHVCKCVEGKVYERGHSLGW